MLGKDLLRLLDTSSKESSVFCIPNCKLKQCIINLSYRGSYLYYILTRFECAEEGLERLITMTPPECGGFPCIFVFV